MEIYPNRGDLTRLAEERGIDQGYLSRLARDERRPGTATRRLFWEGPEKIPMHWWDESVSPSERERVETDPSDPPEPHDSDPEANTDVDLDGPASDSNPKIGASARERTGSNG